MSDLINTAELKAHLSDILAKVSKSRKEVIIGKYGKPVAKLVPFTKEVVTRKLGFAKHLSKVKASDLQHQVDAPTDDDTVSGFYS